MLQFIKTNDGTLYITINGEMHIVDNEHKNYDVISKAVGCLPECELLKLIECSTINVTSSTFTIKDECGDEIEVDKNNNTVKYQNVVFEDAGLVERITYLVVHKYDIKYITNFLFNLTLNPSRTSVQQLFRFINKHGFPITSEGKLLGYKAVRKDGYDIHSGTVYNGIGQYITMPRNQVCDDEDRGCSAGLHIGTLEYARHYGGVHSGYSCPNKIILVEFDPRDVVSVPKNATNKLRCCRYRVVADYNGDSVLEGAVYTPKGELITGADYSSLFNGELDGYVCCEEWSYDNYDNWDDEDGYDEENEEDNDYENYYRGQYQSPY
jgi:hypothetical protein